MSGHATGRSDLERRARLQRHLKNSWLIIKWADCKTWSTDGLRAQRKQVAPGPLVGTHREDVTSINSRARRSGPLAGLPSRRRTAHAKTKHVPAVNQPILSLAQVETKRDKFKRGATKADYGDREITDAEMP